MANSKKKTRRKVLVFSGIAVVLIVLTLLAIFRKRDVVITVQTEKVSRRNITELVVANGKIQPVLQVVINPEVSGGPQIPTFTDLFTGWSSFLTGEGNDTPASLSPLRTTDGGRSWKPFNQHLPVRPSDPGFQFITDRVIFALIYTDNPVNFQAPSELYRTTDGGKTWTTLRYTIS